MHSFLEHFREIKEQKFKTPFWETKEDVLNHWNLKPVEGQEGKYIHATGTGATYDEDEIEHMRVHGVMKPTPLPPEEPEHIRRIPTKEMINRVLQKKERQNAQR